MCTKNGAGVNSRNTTAIQPQVDTNKATTVRKLTLSSQAGLPAGQANARGFKVWFSRASARISHWVGSPAAFILAFLIILVWGITGPYYKYSDTWQLIINTGTTIITFLMVFLIQNTQNRDARALHLKLDEIIRAIQPARNEMIDIEKLSDAELEELSKTYEQLRAECQHRRDAHPADEPAA